MKRKGRKAQSAYNSHMCPKYPKAAALKFGDLKTLNAVLSLKSELAFDDECGTKIKTRMPPTTASSEVNKRTFCHCSPFSSERST